MSPVVPRLDQPQVSPAPLPDARVAPNVPAGAFGVPGQGQLDLSGLTAQARQVYAEQKQKPDELNLLATDNQLSNLRAHLLYDPQAGIIAKRGKDALDASAQMPDQWNQGVSDIGGTIKSDAVRIAFQRQSQEQYRSLAYVMERHVEREMSEYQDQQVTTGLENTRNDVVNAVNGPTPNWALAADGRAKITAIVQQSARWQGAGPATRQAMLANAVSQLDMDVLSTLARSHAAMTKDFYDAHRTEFVADHAGQAAELARQGSTKAGAFAETDAIMAKHPATLSDAVALVSKADPDQRALTTSLLTQEYARQEDSRNERLQANAQAVTDALQRNGGDITQVIGTPQFNGLDESRRSAAYSYAHLVAKGVPVETDPETYFRLRALASSTDPKERQKFLKLNPLDFVKDLSSERFKEIVDTQAKMNQDDPATLAKLAAWRGNDAAVTSVLQQWGYDLSQTPKNRQEKGDAKDVALFRQRVNDAVTAQQRVTERPMSDDEIGDMANRLMLKVKTTAGATEHVFQVKPGEKLIFSTDDVPFRDRNRIVAHLQQTQHRMPTDQEIVSAFVSGLNPLTHSVFSPQPTQPK